VKINASIAVSLAVAVLFVGYFALGTGREALSPDAEKTDAAEDERFEVVARTIAPSSEGAGARFRARTEAMRDVVVRTEVTGRVTATPPDLGALVAEGDVLCEIAVDARKAQLDEAKAALAKASLDYEAAVKLAKDGYRSDTQLAAARADRDLAEARFEAARIALDKTKVRAPFAGVVDERLAEAGDLREAGQGCARLVQLDPVLVVADIAQSDVAGLEVGQPARAELNGGGTLNGRVRFIASAADPATRTFRAEIEAPNPERAARAGVSASLAIATGDSMLHLAPRSALVLGDSGEVGVRVVENGAAVFRPVRAVGERAEQVLIAGLEGPVDLIVRGQGFVADGEPVKVAYEEER